MTGASESTRPTSVTAVDHPVSVICTIRNDAAGLKILLDSLDGQSLSPAEIVIVDGGSHGEALEAVRREAKQRPVVRLIEAGDLNIAQGRNLAVRQARHEIIACIDAGCEADPDWLDRITRPLREDQADVCGGFYVVGQGTRWQRRVGLLSLPGQLHSPDPLRFNPSARSLAFTRKTWRRAGGFPEWLYTAEDTLFDLNLRRLRPAVRYAFAADALVSWLPRATLHGVFRQYYAYARGEGRIGRGEAAQRYLTLRYAALMTWLTAILTLLAQGAVTAASAAALVTIGIAARFSVCASLGAALRMCRKGGIFTIGLEVLRAAATLELLSAARWLGFRAGRRDRQGAPEQFERPLKAYLAHGSGAASLEQTPPWRLVTPLPPRTLVISWHWPPANRASANVLGNLFRLAPRASFRVVTRRMGWDGGGGDPPPFPTARIPWPLPDDRPVRFRTFWAEMRTMAGVFRQAWTAHLDWNVEVVLSVYPTRYSLLAGWLTSRLIGVPHVAYMHDLFRETLVTRSRLKRAFWSKVDGRILSTSTVVFVPTREHADHYARRGIRHCRVLPHTTRAAHAADALLATMTTSGHSPRGEIRERPLRLVYSGAIYEPHADAIEALLRAAERQKDVEVSFYTRPQPLLAGQRVQWLDPEAMREKLAEADACVVVLGWSTPYPDEIRVCFPSKIIDYLEAGRPILAMAPAGSFVDRFVRETGCGIGVNEPEPEAIRAAFQVLQNVERCRKYSAGSRAAAQALEAARWVPKLLEGLCAAAGRSACLDNATATQKVNSIRVTHQHRSTGHATSAPAPETDPMVHVAPS